MTERFEGLPEYFIPIKPLGEGGMGVVWSVRDTRVDKVGALKVIRPQSGTTELALKRFEREIRNFAQLIHPYIVQVYDVGKMLTGEPYIFMEEVHGQPISAAMLKGKSFDEIMQLIDRILEGLDEAHANHIIHRDLKPDNILVTVDDTGALMPKLMDFGLALRADERDMRITVDGMVVGTPIYMAPEQACDDHYLICPATDFYGLGCILYELFCGKPPFEGKNAIMIMTAQARDLPKPFVPSADFSYMSRLAPIINRLLEKDPDRRYECAADFRAALRKNYLIRDNALFSLQALNHDDDTVLDIKLDESTPFLSNELAPKTYKAILPDVEQCNYNYSVLSLRPTLFIGRQSAKHILETYLRDVYNCRRTSVTLITGRPGVGKSRFIDSCIQDFYKKGIAHGLVVHANSANTLRSAIYRAVFNKLLLKTLKADQIKLAVEHFFRITESGDARVRRFLRLYQAEMHSDTERPEDSDPPELAKRHEKLLFNDMFCALTGSRPLVLCIDDMRAEQRQELCNIICELSEGGTHTLPILITVINATTNDMPTDTELALGNETSIWLRRGITIEPLSNTDMRALIRQGLGVCEKLSLFIENLSSGLPEIAVTLARQWQLAGLLKPTVNGYDSVREPSELPIPRDVHEAILHQVYLTFSDYAGRSWLPVASLAAVCGETFTPGLMQTALDFVPTTQRLIRHSTFISLGLSGGVLRTINESTLAFSNPLIRTALLTTLDACDKIDLHRAVASALRQEPSSIDRDRMIAAHLDEAQQYYEAYEAYRVLASHSLQHGELDSASKYIERSEQSLIQHLGYLDAHTPELTEIRFIKAEIALEKGNLDVARQLIAMLEFSCRFFPQPEKHAACQMLRAKLFECLGHADKAKEAIEAADGFVRAMKEPLNHTQLEVKFNFLAHRIQTDPSLHQELLDTARKLNDMLYVGKAFLAIARRSQASMEVSRTTRILNMAIDTAHRNEDTKTEAEALHLLSKIQVNAPEVQLKTLYDALRCYEKLSEFDKVAQLHCEIAEVLRPWAPDDADIHAQWGSLLSAGQYVEK